MKVTVTYRNWLGASKHGLLVLKIRLGHNPAITPDKAPKWVADYLALEHPVMSNVTIANCWCLSTVKSVRELEAIAASASCEPLGLRLLRRDCGQDRFSVNINAPEKDAPKGVSALSVGRALRDYAGPHDFYRSVYKYVDCGPTIGFVLEGEATVYCDYLHELGSWNDLARANRRIAAILVSSIVEGSDAEVPTITIPTIPLRTLHDRVWDAIESVNNEACALWEEAHLEEDCED